MSVKVNSNINIEGNLVANSIIKVGGTSSQFLKADGSIDSNQYVDLTTDQTIDGYKSFNKGIIGSQNGGMIIEGVEGHPALNMPDIISNLGGIAKWTSSFPTISKISFKRNANSTTRLVLRITTGFVSDFCDVLVTMYQQSNSNTYKRVQFLGGRLSVFNQCDFYLEYDSVTEEEIVYTKINFNYPSLTPLSLQAVGGDVKLTQESFSIGFAPQTELDNSNALLIQNSQTIGPDFVDLFYNQTIGGNKTFSDDVQAANFIGDGSSLTNLNYNNISNPPSLNFDNYGSWKLYTNGSQKNTIGSNQIVDFVAGTNVNISYSAGGVVTFSATDTNTIPNDEQVTIAAGNGLSTGGNFTTNQSSPSTITLNHADTSTFNMSSLSGASVISDINTDGFGHITGINTRNLTPASIGAQPAGAYDNYNRWNATLNGFTENQVSSGGSFGLQDSQYINLSYDETNDEIKVEADTNGLVTLDTEQTFLEAGLKTVQVGGKAWIFETDSNKITIGGNEDATTLQPEPLDNGNISIYGESNVKIVDIDGNFDDASTGIQGGYLGVYRGDNGAYCGSLSVRTGQKKVSLVINEYNDGNFGPPTNPTSTPDRMVEVYSIETSPGVNTGGIEMNNPSARFDLGHSKTYASSYSFVNAYNSLFEDKITIKDTVSSSQRTEIYKNSWLTMHSPQDVKTIDIDGNFFDGGYIGVYNDYNSNVGISMHGKYTGTELVNELNIYEANKSAPVGTSAPIVSGFGSLTDTGKTNNFLYIKENPQIVIGGDLSQLKNGSHFFTCYTNGWFNDRLSVNGEIAIGLLDTEQPQKDLHIKGGNDIGIRIQNTNANYWDILNSSLGKLDFIRGGSNFLRIDQLGNVGIGTTSPSEKLDVNGTIQSSLLRVGTGADGPISLTTNDGGGNASITFNHENTTPGKNGNAARISSNVDITSNAELSFEVKENVTQGTSVSTIQIARFRENGAQVTTGALGVGVFPGTVAGRILAADDIIAFSSDDRLKKNKVNINSAIDKIKTLNGFTYNWNEKANKEVGYNTDYRLVGVSAQEIKKVLPEAVKLAPFDNDGNEQSISGEEYLTVQYEKLVPLLIEGMKEQQQQIEELKNLIK